MALTLAFLFLCEVFSFYVCWKNALELTVNKLCTNPHNSTQISCTPKSLFSAFVSFWKPKRVSATFSINKESQLIDSVSVCKLNIYYNTRRTASKFDKIQNGRYKKFYVKTKDYSRHVTKPTWIWSSFNHVTAAKALTTIWCHCYKSII